MRLSKTLNTLMVEASFERGLERKKEGERKPRSRSDVRQVVPLRKVKLKALRAALTSLRRPPVGTSYSSQ